jgi:hypothetical protein
MRGEGVVVRTMARHSVLNPRESRVRNMYVHEITVTDGDEGEYVIGWFRFPKSVTLCVRDAVEACGEFKSMVVTVIPGEEHGPRKQSVAELLAVLDIIRFAPKSTGTLIRRYGKPVPIAYQPLPLWPAKATMIRPTFIASLRKNLSGISPGPTLGWLLFVVVVLLAYFEHN